MKPKSKKSEGSTRSNVLRIRLTVAERQVLEEAAREQGLDTSSWARSELLRGAKKLGKTPHRSGEEGS